MTGPPCWTPPRVGPASTETRPVCVYSRLPGDPVCGEPATRHVLVHAHPDGYDPGPVSLAACDVHAPIARAAGHLIAEHGYAAACSRPDAVWLPKSNMCAATVVVPPHWGDR